MSKEKKVKIGNTEFVKDQFEEGVEKKLKGASPLSIWYAHKAKSK
jgi:hypothetical protein